MGECSVEWCKKPAKGKGLCSSHYHRLVRYGDPLGGNTYRLPKEEYESCKIPGCDGRGNCRGYCSKHYLRLSHNGTLDIKKMPNGSHASSHPLYNSWRAMADRCLTPSNKYYKDYGGRGITICERWRPPYGFWNFVEDMGDKPSYENGVGGRSLYSLDRIDVNGPYSPENCRWASQSQQMNNTRANRKFTAFGVEGTFTELFRKFSPDGLKKKTAERRFYEMSWPLERAITTLPYGGK